jgi:hypothetical protein
LLRSRAAREIAATAALDFARISTEPFGSRARARSAASRTAVMYLSTVLDDYSRYITALKLCTTIRAEDVTDTLELALAASGCDQAPRPTQTAPAVGQRTQLYRRRTGRVDRGAGHEPCARRALPSPDPRQDRALAPDTEEPRAAGELLPTRRPRTPDRGVHRALQPPAHAPLARAWLITAE